MPKQTETTSRTCRETGVNEKKYVASTACVGNYWFCEVMIQREGIMNQ